MGRQLEFPAWQIVGDDAQIPQAKEFARDQGRTDQGIASIARHWQDFNSSGKDDRDGPKDGT